MARLLVTGGAGFIGANFVHYWLDRHPNERPEARPQDRPQERPQERLVVLDALTYAGNRASLAPAAGRPGFRFVEGDVRDQPLVERLLREEELDTVVHFAAESHVDRSISGPDVFLDVNVVGTHALLKAARAVWLAGAGGPTPGGGRPHRFHHVSTDEVYGSLGLADPAFHETTPYAPNSPYAASKAASDHLVRAYHHTYGLATTISNCSNNYGPYQFPEKLIPLALVKLLGGEPVPVYGDGANVRDWLHVEDHCRGIELILERGQPGAVYNIGSDNERPNLEVVRLLCGALDEAFAAEPALARRFPAALAAAGGFEGERFAFVRDRPGHDRRYAIDARRIRSELGYRARIGFEEGLRRTVRWYLDHEDWWRPLLGRDYREWMRAQYGDG